MPCKGVYRQVNKIYDFILNIYLKNIFAIIIYYIIFSAVKQLIVINCIQNKSFCLHNTCMCAVYIYYVYKKIHNKCILLFQKNILF